MPSSGIPPTKELKPGCLLWLGICFLPYIFAWETLRRGYSAGTRLIAFLWMVVILLSLFSAGATNHLGSVETPSPLSSVTVTASPSINAPASPQESPTAERRRKPSRNQDSALDGFRKKVLSVRAGRDLFSRIEEGEVPGVLKIYVRNVWFDMSKVQRRQLTSQLAEIWHLESGLPSIILHIYDFTGHEVAGTKFLGGVWVEDE